MFDFILEEDFEEAIAETFEVLNDEYVHGCSRDLLRRLIATFDERFEVRFIIIDNDTLQAAYPFTLEKREHAEALLECNKNKNLDIAMVLVER
jgi:hypothetical protein